MMQLEDGQVRRAERAVLVGLNADTLRREEIATDASLEELEALRRILHR